jgi:NADH:ubiquinone reductase (H+-translocating)
MTQRSRVVIIGAGFGGLSVANRLAGKPVDVLVIDRNNFHTFTPLLYQVATCGLDPSEIAYPVRSIFRKRQNVRFLLGEVIELDHRQQQITIDVQGRIYHQPYDYLVVATGSVTNFFGMDKLEQVAFGLKDLGDGVRLRNHILKLFERAAWMDDGPEREALLTLVVVGGGPTGLETAGALYELYNHVLANEYSRAQPLKARVMLVEATNSLLLPYPQGLQQAAYRQMQSLGVEIILGQAVEQVESDHIKLSDGQTIHTHTLVWTAGVKGSPLARLLEVELERGERIPVEETMQVTGHDRVYAVGDITYLPGPDGKPYPQLIPVAQQQGRLVAENILLRLDGKEQQPFRYHDRGIMATIGRTRAVAWPFYRVQLTGFLAWVVWLALHLLWLMGFRNRLTVFISWVWNYLTYDRSVRIILERGFSPGDTPEPEAPEDTTMPESD